MRYKVVNLTSLSNREIGHIMDRIISESDDQTNYIGKIERFTISHMDDEKDYKIEIKYMKTYTQWTFTEVLACEHS
jgi:hypothetical protein